MELFDDCDTTANGKPTKVKVILFSSNLSAMSELSVSEVRRVPSLAACDVTHRDRMSVIIYSRERSCAQKCVPI